MLATGYVEHALEERFVRSNELDYWTLEYLVAGTVAVQTAHGRQVLHAPSTLLVPPHTPYSVEWAGAAGPWTEFFAIFDQLPQWKPLLTWPLGSCGLAFLGLPNPTISTDVEIALREAYQLRKSTRVNRQALALNAFERALWILDEINPRAGDVQRDARTERVLAYIAAHYAEPLDLETLASEAFLSPSRFSHLFRAQMRQAPMQYVEHYRLERAAEILISSRDSIEAAAVSVGFANAFHFSTRFRARFGQSPSRYRRRYWSIEQ